MTAGHLDLDERLGAAVDEDVDPLAARILDVGPLPAVLLDHALVELPHIVDRRIGEVLDRGEPIPIVDADLVVGAHRSAVTRKPLEILAGDVDGGNGSLARGRDRRRRGAGRGIRLCRGGDHAAHERAADQHDDDQQRQGHARDADGVHARMVTGPDEVLVSAR